MAVTISKKAERLLDKVETRRELTAPTIKQAPALPPIYPIAKGPEKSLLNALWALSGRPGRTLMMIRRKDGKTYQVKDYNPATRLLTLLAIEYTMAPEVQTKMTQATEEAYEPLWR